ncbi:DUF2357 domain-containing protein [Brevibacillus sp. HD1.4A]|uniref:DUF2357 domain-containing protein n=1 Tax=Brevibacillus sp. HD1.4A TaxID=2738978 RepID=UPI00156AEE3C|nr:DUF2357 domain-containing protein [Brevibacillus sp. HD1.4A]NRQ54525.1 DUF2357 domain-containing protein [Brevibacillus sp. HD1.4A]
MDSHRFGSLRESVELLRIETDVFDLYIKGKPFHPTVEKLQLHRENNLEWEPSTLRVSSDSSRLTMQSKLVFSPITGALMNIDEGDALPIFFETQSYEFVLVRKQEKEITFFHENVHLRQAIKPLGKDILSGILHFQNEVGLTEIVIQMNRQPVLKIELEIFPVKMDYRRDYQNLLREVNEQVYNLAFDFMRKTHQMTGLTETHSQSLTEFYSILQYVFQQLIGAIERIKANPHHKLESQQKVMDASRVKRASRHNQAFLSKNPHSLLEDHANGFLRIQDKLYRPSLLKESRRAINYDTVENRFVRWMLVKIVAKLKEIRLHIETSSRNRDEVFLQKLDRMVEQIRRVLQLDFLAAATGMKQLSVTLVLQMAPGYREIYKAYLTLMKGLTIQGELSKLSMKDIAQLYEYWCFLKINQILSMKYKLLKQDFVKVNTSGLFVTLDRSQSARMVYENPANKERFTLYYNALPSEDKRKVPTLSQRPDNVLTLKKNDSQQEFKYVFDAKYRLNPAYEGTSYSQKYRFPGPEEDDINTMHRYRDAIVYLDGTTHEYERSMYGAYVLFPYPNEEQFRQHQFYKSIELINIGAFPFLPGATSLLEQFLDELILDSPEKAYERSTRPRGTDRYYQDKLGGKNVLVGSLRTGQLELALKHKFYHVPLKNLKDHKVLTQIEYVALCQSRKQFRENGGIHWYGSITDWKVVRRKDILERTPRPGTEEELYVRFEVNKWIKREKPIQFGGQGIYTLLLTTKYMFDRADEISELRLDDEEQLKQWREKRRRGKVKVVLDHEYIDLAEKVRVEEVPENHR